MHRNARHELNEYLKDVRSQYALQSKRLAQLEGYVSRKLKVRKHPNGTAYYSVLEPGSKKYKYLGKECDEEVSRIKEAHLLQLSVKELEREIQLVEKTLKLSRNIGYEQINKRLSPVYRNSMLSEPSGFSDVARKWKKKMEEYKSTFPPYKPEDLIHRTRDGTYVRSKGEALIYNYLLDIGITFVYELPLKIKVGNRDSLILPDFTILSEIDYKSVIFIEHQGMMDSSVYRDKFNNSVYKYWINGYLPERDVFFTFDLPNGGFDDTAVRNIIHSVVRPATLH